jgi:hypothetical protein
MFEKTVELFDEYYRTADKTDSPGFIRDLGCELRKRLQQLDFIIHQVHSLEELAKSAMTRSQDALRRHVEDLKSRGIPYVSVVPPPEVHMTQGEMAQEESATFRLEIFTETFYFLAFRVRTILKHKPSPLPFLGSFECKGVRDVRNKLLEHVEGSDSQVWIQSFAWGSPHGPVLKAIRPSDQTEVFPDQGLLVNAEEFKKNLEARVLDAIRNLKSASLSS